ncbi:MAG: mechanosensitive ion channel family protein [Melioribacter sp.]|nr:mechanosensitive ion channel family protein [Melioribacter sp.]
MLITKTFYVTQFDYKNYLTDYVFFVAINILFWYSISYLLNKLIDYFLWNKVFGITVGKFGKEWIKEIFSSLIYTISTALILKNAFWIKLNIFWILVLILLFLVLLVIRPKILSLFSREAFSYVKPFNLGDWISIRNNDGNIIILGKVHAISRGLVLIKNESNNLVFVPISFLSNKIIENYTTENDYSKFSTKICIDHNVQIERVKRILLASAQEVYQYKKIYGAPEPIVLVNEINENGIVYELVYWIKQWTEVNPKEFNDIILTTAIKNLSYSGIYPAYQKHDVFMGNYQKKLFDISEIEDRKNILKNVEIFNFLNEDELKIIAENVNMKVFHKNEFVIKEGEEGKSMFILVEGLLNVFVKNQEGIEVHVGNIRAGDFFGEMSLFTGERRSATVVAKTDSLIFEINKEIISPIIHSRKNLAEEFGKIIAQRQAINIDRIAESQVHEKSLLKVIIERIKNFFNL